jgi:hypothetical protein
MKEEEEREFSIVILHADARDSPKEAGNEEQ